MPRRLTTNGFQQTLKRHITGDVLFDEMSRLRYSVNAGSHQLLPMGIVVPRNETDVFIAFEIARDYGVSITIRGAGTSAVAQSLGKGLIIDTSRHLTALLNVDSSSLIAVVQPGIGLDALNRQLKPLGLWFPVQPLKSSQATLGGMLGNNAINCFREQYGDTVHSVVGIDALFSDGTQAYIGGFGLNAQPLKTTKLRQLVSQLFELTAKHQPLINQYAFKSIHSQWVNYTLGIFSGALPVSMRPYTADGSVNLAHLLVGSRGTLVYFNRLYLQLVRLSDSPPERLYVDDTAKNTTLNSSVISEQMYEWLGLLKQVKQLFDPTGLMGSDLFPQRLSAIKPVLGQTVSWLPSGLSAAINQCHHQGICQSLATDTACPSYSVTRQDQHSTRGRANTIRFVAQKAAAEGASKVFLSSAALNEAMALCVACKACQQECPSAINMSAVKSGVVAAQRDEQIRLGVYGLRKRVREWLLCQLPWYVPTLKKFHYVFNTPVVQYGLAKAFNYASVKQGRTLPKLSPPLLKQIQHINGLDASPIDQKTVILWVDTFNHAFESENVQAAHTVLLAAGYRVYTTDLKRLNAGAPLCCGRTAMAAGNFKVAKESAANMIAAILPLIEQGATLVGLEPACLLMAHDEWLSMGFGEVAKRIKQHALLFEEFLVREVTAKRLSLVQLNLQALPYTQALVHEHCHQKAFQKTDALTQVLRWIPALKVKVIQSACCGMVDTFGYDASTFAVSRAMADLQLLPAIEQVTDTVLLVANGAGCRHQIKDATPHRALHIARVLSMAIHS
jgi:Fe-S oxidoreductase